jgi:hypothetical protein
MEDINILKINDLNIASLLVSRGYKLKGLQWSNREAFFEIEDPDGDADELIQAYYNADVMGNIKKFCEGQKTLKSMLHSKYKNYKY